MGQTKYGPPVVMGSEDIMAPKAHGTCTQPVQSDLRFGCDTKTADKICCFNRHYAFSLACFRRAALFCEPRRSRLTSA